ncbi:hypothetical protein D3C74_372980 [compost metagenome]
MLVECSASDLFVLPAHKVNVLQGDWLELPGLTVIYTDKLALENLNREVIGNDMVYIKQPHILLHTAADQLYTQ